MVSGLEYGVAGCGGGGGGGGEDGEDEEEESWLQFLFKSQINRPPGSRAKVKPRVLCQKRGRVASVPATSCPPEPC